MTGPSDPRSKLRANDRTARLLFFDHTHPPVTGGTYTLVVRLPEATTLSVGALGDRRFPAGWYAYTGSALGSGGFARVDRHHAVADGENDVRHWHVDYLLGHPTTRIETVVRSPNAAVECAVADRIDGDVVEGFGASDCDCAGHLHHGSDWGALVASVRAAHETAAGSDGP